MSSLKFGGMCAFYECVCCGKDQLAVFPCERCGVYYGNWSKQFCSDCLCSEGGYCDRCEQYCCWCCKTESEELHQCCGMIICGSGNMDPEIDKETMKEHATWHKREYGYFLTDDVNDGTSEGSKKKSRSVENISYACIWEHKTKTLDCGHVGFNFYGDKGCYTCNQNAEAVVQDAKIQADKKLVEEILPRIQSDSLRKHLQNWKANPCDE